MIGLFLSKAFQKITNLCHSCTGSFLNCSIESSILWSWQVMMEARLFFRLIGRLLWLWLWLFILIIHIQSQYELAILHICLLLSEIRGGVFPRDHFSLVPLVQVVEFISIVSEEHISVNIVIPLLKPVNACSSWE